MLEARVVALEAVVASLQPAAVVAAAPADTPVEEIIVAEVAS